MLNTKLGKISWSQVVGMLIEAVYLAVFFAVPLAMDWFLPTDNVFELNKVVMFRSLVYILFTLTLAKALFWPSAFRISRRYFWPTMALLIFGAVSLFFSVNPANSYQGLSDRQQGYRTCLFYAWWFSFLFCNLVTAQDFDKKLERIFWVIMGSSFLVGLYAVLQILGIDFVAWTEPPFVTHRATSTLGQPNYLGSYLLLVIPLSIYGLVRYRQRLVRFALGLLLALQLVALVVTGSRAAWLGLLGSLGFLALWRLSGFWSKLPAAKKRLTIAISVLAVILLSWLLLQNNYIARRLEGITNFRQGSVSVRFNFWSGALKSIAQKPLLGYGLENQGEEFIKYYQANWAETGFVNASTNRAHNLILDILLTTGIVGLILYLWLYGSFFRWSGQNRHQEKYRWLSEVLAVAVLGLLISLLFGFSIIVTEIYFWSYYAIVAAIKAREQSQPGENFNLKLGAGIKALLVILALAFSVYQISREIRSLVADNYFMEMKQVVAQNDYPRALFYYQKIKEQNADNFNYRYYLVDSLPYDLATSFTPPIANLFEREINNILPTLDRADCDYYYLKAKIFTLLKDSGQANDNYQKMIEISPELPQNYLARAKSEVVSGQDDLALADLKKTLELLPAPKNYPEALSTSEKSVAYYRALVNKELGEIYLRQGKYFLAADSFQAAYKLNLKDLISYKKIADSYFMSGDVTTAIWYNLRAAERHPDDYVWPFSAALLYNQVGDGVKALEYLDRAINLDVNKKIPVDVINDIKSKAN